MMNKTKCPNCGNDTLKELYRSDEEVEFYGPCGYYEDDKGAHWPGENAAGGCEKCDRRLRCKPKKE